MGWAAFLFAWQDELPIINLITINLGNKNLTTYFFTIFKLYFTKLGFFDTFCK